MVVADNRQPLLNNDPSLMLWHIARWIHHIDLYLSYGCPVRRYRYVQVIGVDSICLNPFESYDLSVTSFAAMKSKTGTDLIFFLPWDKLGFPRNLVTRRLILDTFARRTWAATSEIA